MKPEIKNPDHYSGYTTQPAGQLSEPPGKDNKLTPEILISDVKKVNASKITIPLEVFPETIQDFIYNLRRCKNIPEQYSAAAILVAVAAANGQAYQAKVSGGYTDKSILWVAIVGESSQNKSEALNSVLRPLQKIDTDRYKNFKKELITWKNITNNPQPKPHWQQIIVNDHTPEALIPVHENNPKGLLIHSDEIFAWLNSFNRYNKGGGRQAMLSFWKGNAATINRKTQEPLHIPETCVSVAGTVQPEKITNQDFLLTSDGFGQRFLYVYCDESMRVFDSEAVPQNIVTYWEKTITRINEYEYNPQKPKILEATQETKTIYREWYSTLTVKANQPENKRFVSYLKKADIQVIRLALILELLRCSSTGNTPEKITPESMKGATRLMDYFIEQFKTLYYLIINKETDPLARYSDNIKDWYEALPSESLEIQEIYRVGKIYHLPERTVRYYLAKSDLFSNLKRGVYEKKIK